jgi:hypothetical protein
MRFLEFLSTHKFWLALWEPEFTLELPAGVWMLYSSALFTHFNIHPGDVKGFSLT